MLIIKIAISSKNCTEIEEPTQYKTYYASKNFDNTRKKINRQATYYELCQLQNRRSLEKLFTETE